MSAPERRLGVVMVVGACRDRGQHALERLCAQSAIDAMQIVVVDVAPEDAQPLSVHEGAPAEILRLPGNRYWGPARRAGLERLETPIVGQPSDRILDYLEFTGLDGDVVEQDGGEHHPADGKEAERGAVSNGAHHRASVHPVNAERYGGSGAQSEQ